MPVRIRTCNPCDKSPYPVRYLIGYIFRAKKRRNGQKGGPGRNRTCDLADMSPYPVRYHFDKFFSEKSEGLVGPAGFEPATWRKTAYNLYGYINVLSFIQPMA